MFIINKILSYKPNMQIVIIGYQNEMRRPEQVAAQEAVAKYWQIPFFNSSDSLG
jgi:hypothetical protein